MVIQIPFHHRGRQRYRNDDDRRVLRKHGYSKQEFEGEELVDVEEDQDQTMTML